MDIIMDIDRLDWKAWLMEKMKHHPKAIIRKIANFQFQTKVIWTTIVLKIALFKVLSPCSPHQKAS